MKTYDAMQTTEPHPMFPAQRARKNTRRKILAVGQQHALGIMSGKVEGLELEVQTARDAAEGIKFFENGQRFDMIVVDAHRLEIDGRRLADYLAEDCMNRLPIVGITDSLDLRSIDKTLFDLILIRPFKMDLVLNLIAFFYGKLDKLPFHQSDKQTAAGMGGQ